jgi:hypothetical protein
MAMAVGRCQRHAMHGLLNRSLARRNYATYMEPRVCGVQGEVPGLVGKHFKLKVGS